MPLSPTCSRCRRSSAAVRTTDARAELAQQKRRSAKEAAREAKRPKKPRLAMADKRVRASQEPMNELNELLSREEGGWSSLEEAELLPKLGALAAGVVALAALLTQNYDDMDELVRRHCILHHVAREIYESNKM